MVQQQRAQVAGHEVAQRSEQREEACHVDPGPVAARASAQGAGVLGQHGEGRLDLQQQGQQTARARVCVASASRPQTMAVACGADFTIALTDNSDVWSLGEGEDGQLGLGTTGHQNKPAWVVGVMSSRNLLS